MARWPLSRLGAIMSLMAAVLKGGSVGGNAEGSRLMRSASARGEPIKLYLPIEGEGMSQPFGYGETPSTPTSPRYAHHSVAVTCGLVMLIVSATLFLMLQCAARLKQHHGALGGKAAAAGLPLSGRRLAGAEGVDLASSCASNPSEDFVARVQKQVKLLEISSAEKAGLTSEELTLIQQARDTLRRLRRDEHSKRLLADGFRFNLKEEEDELQQKLAQLSLGEPIPLQLKTFRDDIEVDKKRLRVMDEERLSAQRALAAVSFEPVQAAQAIFELARRRSTAAPAITVAGAQALTAARVVLEGQTYALPEVTAELTSALEGLTRDWIEELQRLTSSVQDVPKHLSRPVAFWSLIDEISGKLADARHIHEGLSLLRLPASAQQLLAVAETLEGEAEKAAREVKKQITAWAEQTKKMREGMERRAVESIALWQTQFWAEELRVKVINRVQAALATPAETEEDLEKREQLWFECKDLLSRAASVPAHAVTGKVRQQFDAAVHEARKTLELLQSQVWFQWLDPVEKTSKRLAYAENGVKQAYQLALAAHTLQGTGTRYVPPSVGEETPKGKLPAEQNNLLYFVSEVRAAVDKAVEYMEKNAYRTPHSPPLAAAMLRLGDRINLAEKAVDGPIEWLVSVWKAELDSVVQEYEEAKEALKEMRRRGETDEDVLKAARRKVNRAEDAVQFVLAPCLSVDRYLRQLDTPRHMVLPLMSAIRKAGGSPLAATPLALRLDTTGDEGEEVLPAGSAPGCGTLRRASWKGFPSESSGQVTLRGSLKRNKLSSSLPRISISTPSNGRPLSQGEPIDFSEFSPTSNKTEGPRFSIGGEGDATTSTLGRPLSRARPLNSSRMSLTRSPRASSLAHLPDLNQRMYHSRSMGGLHEGIRSTGGKLEKSQSLNTRKGFLQASPSNASSLSSASNTSDNDELQNAAANPKQKRWRSLRALFTGSLSKRPKSARPKKDELAEKKDDGRQTR
ncbi:hypothetical protein Emag_004844 [Eimeria magna]